MKEGRFGEYLKNLRLERGFGLRRFARMIQMDASNLSNIERGRINPPRNKEALERITNALGLKSSDKEYQLLFDLSRIDQPDKIPADLVDYTEKTKVIPLLLRTVANKKLTEQQIRALIEDINRNF